MAKKKKVQRKLPRLESFDFEPGRILAKKYRVESLLGKGWEAEVYRLSELNTGVERAGKFFYPHRNPHNRTLKNYARKLHKLKDCSMVIQYHTQESFWHRGHLITFLVSEYVEGELLSAFVERQAGKKLHFYQALHLLHQLASGLEQLHFLKEYHGDLHSDNIMIRSHGLGFDLKVLDMYWWGSQRPENIQEDVIKLIRLFYDALGGQKHYAKQPPEIKELCSGLKRSLILKKFKTAGKLREYIERMEWH